MSASAARTGKGATGQSFSPGPFSDGGSGVEDGFGSFNQKVDDFDGYTHATSSLQFLLTNTSSTWASAADVLTPNASGYVAGAHIFVADCGSSASCDAGGTVLATGFATVPEPSTALMLASGLAGLSCRRRGLFGVER